jgi:hypothetical protein
VFICVFSTSQGLEVKGDHRGHAFGFQELLSLIAIVNFFFIKMGRGPSENVEKARRKIENFKIPIYLSLLCSCPFDMLFSLLAGVWFCEGAPLHRHIL